MTVKTYNVIKDFYFKYKLHFELSTNPETTVQFPSHKQHKLFLGTVVLNSNDIHIITDFETIKVYNSFEQINKPSVIRYLFKKH